MKNVFLIGALFCAAEVAVAQAPSATPRAGAGGPRTDLENDSEIRQVFEQFEDAWNRHDVDALAGLWTIDGDHVEPDGRQAKGRDEVQKLFQAEHATAFKESKLDLDIQTVWFMTADVALVDGTYELSGVHDPQGNALPPRKGRLTSIMLEERSRWWVAASRLMIPTSLAWRDKQGP